MSNTVKLAVTQYDIDVSSVITSQFNWDNVKTYTFIDKQNFTTPDTTSSPAYVAINFGQITTAKFLRIQSDQVLSVKLNGGSQVFSNVKMLTIDADITAISIENTSGETATIQIEIYGD